MQNFHISQVHERIGLNGNIPFYISMLKDSLKILKNDVPLKVLDFGCGSGVFLQMVDLFIKVKYALGVDCDESRIQKAIKNNKLSNVEYKLDSINNDFLAKQEHLFNVVYAQEVLYTITDLHSHAKLIYDILESNGVYFATIGCHTDNPFFNEWRREIIREEEIYPVNEYSLDYITETFSSAGFEVGLKRLSLEYFCIYHPSVIKEFGSMINLVKHCSEYKMLFCFFKAKHNDKD